MEVQDAAQQFSVLEAAFGFSAKVSVSTLCVKAGLFPLGSAVVQK